ncbi:RNA polymerase sigma factor [Streptomyces sp. NPDC014623]|uniref:RNA polymerase sigma factor n=1 Tax=Streptomyces sp. NPDC014623 TaxID=3364875 RepID=UPI0036FD6E96
MKDRPPPARRPPGPGNRWELVWSHRDELLEIARRLSSNTEEAEDAVQEAMLRAVEDPGVQYGRVRSWLRLATERVCAERRRQIARDSEASTSPYAAPAEPSPVEEAACDRAEARWLADRSAELLPARQAEALRLHSQDLDVGQVARAMGLSYRAAESLLARARRSLRDVLAGILAPTAAAWMFVRRFPFPPAGVAPSAVAASAAVTVAVAGLSLPAAAPGRPDDRPPGAGAGALRPAPAAEPPAIRAVPGHAPTPPPPPDPQRASGPGQGTRRSGPGGSPATHEPRVAAALRIRIGPLVPAPELPSAVTPTAVPSLPVNTSGVSAVKRPPVPSGTVTGTATAFLPRPEHTAARSRLPVERLRQRYGGP